MTNLLKNKIALVTGGAGGIGSAICKKLADEGASVIVTYNSNAEKAENLVKILNDIKFGVGKTLKNIQNNQKMQQKKTLKK